MTFPVVCTNTTREPEAVRKGNLPIDMTLSSRVHKNPLCDSRMNSLTLWAVKERRTHVATVCNYWQGEDSDTVHIGP
jgi:hypothetical protein